MSITNKKTKFRFKVIRKNGTDLYVRRSMYIDYSVEQTDSSRTN